MRKKIISLILLFSALHAQTLQDALEDMLETNPTIQERLNNYKVTNIDIKSAKSGYYPKIDLMVAGGKEKTDRDYMNVTYDVYQSSIKYTQNLFNGFNTTHLVDEEEFRTVAAAYSYIEKVNSLAFDLASAYLEVIKNQKLLDISKENVTIDEEILSKVKKLYKFGLTTLSEVNKVESSLALAKSNYIVQENTLLNASYNLEKLLGKRVKAHEMVKPTLQSSLFPKRKEEALETALKNNPSLIVSNYNIELAKSTKKAAEANYYPKVDIELAQTYNHNLGGSYGKNDVSSAMIYLSYNLFSGFGDEAAIEKALVKTAQENNNKNILKREVIQSLNLAWTAREKLNEQLLHLKKYKEFSNKTLQLYTKEYDLGRRSLLDLLSAQNDFIQSRAQIITTQYSILYAEYKILSTMGVLVDTIMGNSEKLYNRVAIKKEK